MTFALIAISLRSIDAVAQIERLRTILADPGNHLSKFKYPVPLPLDPIVNVVGIVPGTQLVPMLLMIDRRDANDRRPAQSGINTPETAYMFKSAKQPLLLTFKTDSDKDYTVASAGSTIDYNDGTLL